MKKNKFLLGLLTAGAAIALTSCSISNPENPGTNPGGENVDPGNNSNTGDNTNTGGNTNTGDNTNTGGNTNTGENTSQDTKGIILESGGYNEGAYVLAKAGKTYTFEYKEKSASSYTKVDSNLVRTTSAGVRCDVLGLKAGDYDFKVSSGSEEKVVSLSVAKDDRSGYAHFGTTTGVGAYNNDGTLKNNAQIVYVTEENKNTVALNGKTGLANILKAQSSSSNPLVVRIVGTVGAAVWNQLEYDPNGTYRASKNMPTSAVVDKNGKQIPAGNYTEEQIIANGYNTLNTSTYSKLDGLTNKIKKDSDGSMDSYYNMLDISNAKNVTIEGVGNDATIDSWGFTWKNCSYIEVKNITFQNNPEDACSFEGSDTGVTSLSGFKTGNIWVHNNTFKSGVNPWDVCTEQDKHDGDGATDIKGLRNITISYNHYIKNHKTGLVGGSGSQTTANVTFHHNWYDGNQARLPYGRQANMHMYNNYYDSSTGTNMQIHDGGYAFIENCYFKNTKKTFEAKKNSTNQAPAIKLWNNTFDNCSQTSGTFITLAEKRGQAVDNGCRFGKNFDTDASVFYYNTTTNSSDVALMLEAKDVPAFLKKYAGAGACSGIDYSLNHTETNEAPEVVVDTTTKATYTNSVPTTAGTYGTVTDGSSTYYQYSDAATVTVNDKGAISLVDLSDSQTTFAYVIFDTPYTSGTHTYKVNITLEGIGSKWSMVQFMDGNKNIALRSGGTNSAYSKKYTYMTDGATENLIADSSFSTHSTYTIILTVDYDNNTAKISINGNEKTITNYTVSSIKGIQFMTAKSAVDRSFVVNSVEVK